jgi:pimeloyl-ACP methyl ester carboxylesterase
VALVCPRLGAAGDDRQAFETKVAEMLEEVDVGVLLDAGGHEPDISFRDAMAMIFPLGFLRFGLTERAFMKRIAFRRQAYDAAWQALGESTLAGRLSDLSIPALLLAGRYDPFVDLSGSRDRAGVMSGARFLMFHNSAHWPFLEEPHSFSDAIWSWMEEVAAHIV